jgi:glutaredoxin-like YruB-family protein
MAKRSSKKTAGKQVRKRVTKARAKRTAGPHIIIYTTATCPFCKLAKELLASKKVTFTEHDVLRDRAWADEMMRKSGQMGVPVLDIDGKIIVGYDKEGILKALKK